ncbi:MAG: agmatinase [Candidatus Methylomirabilia bacterium]
MRGTDPRFIGCAGEPGESGIILFGIPFEGSVNLRKGAHRGPQDLRLASDSIETYSLALGRDLEALAPSDLGDCALDPSAPPRAQLSSAREQVRAFWTPGIRLVMLGGDHTATHPVIEVLAERLPDLRVLQLDAHPDTRAEFLGERYNYASAMARVLEIVGPERLYQVGMRTGSREEIERRGPHFYPATEVAPRDALRRILGELRRYPLYVTLDIDILDPSEAAGTGSPEPGGLRFTELAELLRLLVECNVVGMDLVEVAHAHDPSGRTGIVGSSILREAILGWWGK